MIFGVCLRRVGGWPAWRAVFLVRPLIVACCPPLARKKLTAALSIGARDLLGVCAGGRTGPRHSCGYEDQGMIADTFYTAPKTLLAGLPELALST